MDRLLMRWSLMVALVALLGACSTNPVTGESDIAVVSQEQEMVLGRKGNQAILRQYGYYNDVDLQRYVREVGSRITRVSHREHLHYRFAVLDTPLLNAFSLPGGFVYVTRGLLANLNHESQLAAVLAHEIGHIAARHGLLRMRLSSFTRAGTTIGAMLLPGIGGVGTQLLLESLGGMVLGGYGREHELEADQLAAKYLSGSGYPPGAMLEVIDLLKDQEQFEQQKATAEGREPEIYHGLFSTHPENRVRLQQLVHHLEEGNQERKQARPIAEGEVFLGRLDGLVIGESTRQGVIVRSNYYRYDLDLLIPFPEQWQLSRSDEQLVAVAPHEQATFQFSLKIRSATGDPRMALAKHFRTQKIEQLLTIGGNGFTIHTALAQVRNGFIERQARIGVLLKGLRAYYFAAQVVEDGSFDPFDRLILGTLQGVARLSDEQRRLCQPQRLGLMRVATNTRYADLAQQNEVNKVGMAYLRLLNSHYPDAEPTAGSLIKTVVGQ